MERVSKREVEGGEGLQLPKAFGQQTGEQLVRVLNIERNGTTQVQEGFNNNLLSGTDSSCLQCIRLRV